MRAPDDSRGIINVIVTVIIIAATVIGPLIERWRRKKAQERGETPPPEPEPAEPKLPYEDVVDEVFGPYMERRKREHEERRAAKEARQRKADEEPEGSVIRILEEAPAGPPARPVPEPPPAARPAAREAPPAAGPRRRSLDEVLFSNRRLSPGAKLVVAAEILGRPKAARRPR